MDVVAPQSDRSYLLEEAIEYCQSAPTLDKIKDFLNLSALSADLKEPLKNLLSAAGSGRLGRPHEEPFSCRNSPP
ncbi:hypothetical protein KTN05_10650, partial [Paracoccus sp. Z118]|nr:hypothetical protein [Paracoccus sp. Z118]